MSPLNSLEKLRIIRYLLLDFPSTPDENVLARMTALKRKENHFHEHMGIESFFVPSSLLSINKVTKDSNFRISPTEIIIVLHLISISHHKKSNFPEASKSWLAEEMGLSPRQIQRALSNLEEKGLISKISRYENNLRLSNQYDLSGLFRILDSIKEF